ncbi:MAG: aminotransferase class I/II-fold pyridoxal phosphate-dependent enzyme [Gammaproteobacteria bacterium]|nr:aminotransferase class I/II-fold pyridoxal phosphate-dependent enzyme [Gammaproteobacteria bacterium]
MIPMVDLKNQYKKLKPEIDALLDEVFETTAFILGPNVQKFEQEVASMLGVKHALSCASGTDALHLALRAAGIGPGDEVITSTFTFIATAEAICYVGATPVFVDIDPLTFNLDPELVSHAINDKTRAILPVHLFGQPADMPRIMTLAEQHNLVVIEDCAQSFGAKVNDQYTGTIGLAGCHSFFPSKNLGCYGDGGMITLNDDTLADEIRMLRNHGSRQRYHHDVIGYNSRLDEIQAAILRVKLRYIEEYNHNRYRVAQQYSSELRDVVRTPHEDKIGNHVYHQYTLLSPQRDKLMKALSEKQIANAIYYPIPLHQQKAFSKEYADISLPVSEQVAKECMSLPIYPELTQAQITQITDTIKSQL